MPYSVSGWIISALDPPGPSWSGAARSRPRCWWALMGSQARCAPVSLRDGGHIHGHIHVTQVWVGTVGVWSKVGPYTPPGTMQSWSYACAQCAYERADLQVPAELAAGDSIAKGMQERVYIEAKGMQSDQSSWHPRMQKRSQCLNAYLPGQQHGRA